MPGDAEQGGAARGEYDNERVLEAIVESGADPRTFPYDRPVRGYTLPSFPLAEPHKERHMRLPDAYIKREKAEPMPDDDKPGADKGLREHREFDADVRREKRQERRENKRAMMAEDEAMEREHKLVHDRISRGPTPLDLELAEQAARDRAAAAVVAGVSARRLSSPAVPVSDAAMREAERRVAALAAEETRLRAVMKGRRESEAVSRVLAAETDAEREARLANLSITDLLREVGAQAMDTAEAAGRAAYYMATPQWLDTYRRRVGYLLREDENLPVVLDPEDEEYEPEKAEKAAVLKRLQRERWTSPEPSPEAIEASLPTALVMARAATTDEEMENARIAADDLAREAIEPRDRRSRFARALEALEYTGDVVFGKVPLGVSAAQWRAERDEPGSSGLAPLTSELWSEARYQTGPVTLFEGGTETVTRILTSHDIMSYEGLLVHMGAFWLFGLVVGAFGGFGNGYAAVRSQRFRNRRLRFNSALNHASRGSARWANKLVWLPVVTFIIGRSMPAPVMHHQTLAEFYCAGMFSLLFLKRGGARLRFSVAATAITWANRQVSAFMYNRPGSDGGRMVRGNPIDRYPNRGAF